MLYSSHEALEQNSDNDVQNNNANQDHIASEEYLITLCSQQLQPRAGTLNAECSLVLCQNQNPHRHAEVHTAIGVYFEAVNTPFMEFRIGIDCPLSTARGNKHRAERQSCIPSGNGGPAIACRYLEHREDCNRKAHEVVGLVSI